MLWHADKGSMTQGPQYAGMSCSMHGRPCMSVLHCIASQVLRKDLDTLQSLVEKVVRQSAAGGAAALAPGGDGGALLDACVAVGALAAAHETTQLPRVEALDAALAVLEERCVAAKSRMTVDVINMLRCISQQQVRNADVIVCMLSAHCTSPGQTVSRVT